MSNLKDFMADNRHEFDDEQPGEHNWDRITKAVPALRDKKRSPGVFYRVAAAAMLVITAGIGIYMMNQRKPSDTVKGPKQPANDIRALAPEYAASAEPIYQAIEKQQQELKSLSASQPELYGQFTQDLATLDSSYRVLKAQAAKSANKEILIRAMMNNLQLQAELLSKQLSILTEYNNHKNEDHDKEKDYRRI